MQEQGISEEKTREISYAELWQEAVAEQLLHGRPAKWHEGIALGSVAQANGAWQRRF